MRSLGCVLATSVRCATNAVYFFSELWPREFESHGYKPLQPPELWYVACLTQVPAMERRKLAHACRYPYSMPRAGAGDD